MTATSKKLIISALAVIVASLMLEVGARFFAFIDQPLVSGNQLFEEKFFVMRHLDYSKKPTIFLMGDSTMNRAVYPDLLQALLEKRGMHVQVVNLAFDGARIPEILKLLQSAEALNIKPAMVLLDFTGANEFSNTPAPLPDKPDQPDTPVNEEVKRINASYMGRCILCKRKRTLAGLQCWLEDNSIFIRNRAYLKQRFLDFISTQANARLYEWSIVKPFSDHMMSVSNLGWNPNHFIMSKESYAVDAERVRKKASEDESLALAKDGKYYLNLNSFEPMRAYCSRHQIKFVLTWLPRYLPCKIKDRCSLLFSGAINQDWAETTFENSADPAKNLYACVIRGLGDDMLYYNDPFHMNTYGAVEATKKLADVLSQAQYRSMLEDPFQTKVSVNPQ